MKKGPGKRRLLEDDDDREKLTDGAGKGKKKEKRKRKGGSAGGAGRRGKKAQASKNTGGQGRDRVSPRGARAPPGALVGGHLGRNRCGIRLALIRDCTPRDANRCKRCGRSARIFCTWFQ